MFFVFVLVCFLVLFVSIYRTNLYYFVPMLLFFCDKTKWYSCLHLVVLLLFLFFVVLF